MITVKTPMTLCRCGYAMDAASPAGDGGKPEPGDVSLCLNCGAIMVFSPAMVPENVSPEEEARLLVEYGSTGSLLHRAQQLIRERGPIPRKEADEARTH